MMLDLENPRAVYVLAAYAVAGAALLALLLVSWCSARRRRKEWAALQGKK